MEIKRTTEIFVETERRFVVCQPESGEQIFCRQCTEQMLAAETCAALFGVSRRSVYKIVETGTAHFTETESGAVMLCLRSLRAAILNYQRPPIAAIGNLSTEKQEK
jgi:hypothetical protein